MFEPNYMMNETLSSAAAPLETIALQIPQWMIELHQLRKQLFLCVIEPLIEAILGPSLTRHSNHDGIYAPDYEFTHVDSQHRRLGFLPSYIEDASSFHATSMSFATLTMMYIFMVIILLVFLSCFYHNQKTSPLFVSPRRHRLPKLTPPPLPVDRAFSWVEICLFINDEEIIDKVGFDALIFLRFHRLALRCIVKMSVFSFLVLMPLNFTGGGRSKANDLKGYVDSLLFTDLLRFSMANISSGSSVLWVHCLGAYLLTIIVINELLTEYDAYSSIRHRYLLSKEPHLRTILVSNIPRHLRSPRKIGTYFRQVYPEAVKSVTICQNLRILEKMVAERTSVLAQIEKELLVLCRYEKRNLLARDHLTRIASAVRTCNLCEQIGMMDEAQERISKLYIRLEDMNKLIRTEQTRRRRIMMYMDKMSSGDGQDDIDYTLASTFDARDSPAWTHALINRRKHATASRDSSQTTKSILKKTNVELGDIDTINQGFGEDQHSMSDFPGKTYAQNAKLTKAKQAIKQYSGTIRDGSLFGKAMTDLTQLTEQQYRQNGSIEDHSNEVTDKAFVVMRTYTASTIAIQSMHSSKPGSMRVSTAPEPRDILWENIYLSKGARRTRAFLAEFLCLLIIAFYAVPVALVSLLVSESALISISPRLNQLDKASAIFSAAIATVQPMFLVGIQMLLPPLFIRISQSEGILSFSEAQMKAFSRYFMFQVVNIFLVTSIAGSIFDTLAIILETPETAFEMLGDSLPRMSSFFVSFVTIKTFIGLGVEISRIFNIMQSSLLLTIFPNSTLRAKRSTRLGMRAIDDPGWFMYHKVLAQDMLVVVISVVFAVVAPIVLVPCALFCFASRIIWTHQFLYVYESAFETGGLFWPKIFRRFVFGLLIAQATITGQFILKNARHEAYATIALMFLTYVFLRSTRARYDATTKNLPLEVATVMDISMGHGENLKQQRRTYLKQQQKISVAQNVTENTENSVNQENSTGKRDDESLGNLIGDSDPFEFAYVQPVIRATANARPEQPFPPEQLGREEILFGTSAGSTVGVIGEDALYDESATVRVQCHDQQDRRHLNQWWRDQLRRHGHQRFFHILIGEESGTLTCQAIPSKFNNCNGQLV